jgi:hypothetical protein
MPLTVFAALSIVFGTAVIFRQTAFQSTTALQYPEERPVREIPFAGGPAVPGPQ